jgi:adenylate kinase
MRDSSDNMNIVLLGPPGAGKGTQAELLSGHLGIPHVSSGDLFRENIAQDTPLGKLAENYIDKGILVPDDVTMAMVGKRLEEPDCHEGVALDGFPRNMAQAKALEEMLGRHGGKVDRAFYIRIGVETSVRRLTGRRTCSDCGANYHLEFNPPKEETRCDGCSGELYQRPDDSAETIRKRFQVYLDETTPLIHYYKEKGLVVEIDGERDIEEVRDQILAALSVPR